MVTLSDDGLLRYSMFRSSGIEAAKADTSMLTNALNDAPLPAESPTAARRAAPEQHRMATGGFPAYGSM